MLLQDLIKIIVKFRAEKILSTKSNVLLGALNIVHEKDCVAVL